MENFPDVRDHGFYIVTTTYSSPEVYVLTLRETLKTVAVGFKAGVPSIGEIAPATECHFGNFAGEWSHPIRNGNEEKVVFFDGLFFEYYKHTGWFREHKFKATPILKGPRGDSTEEGLLIADPENEDDAYEVNVMSKGLLS